LTRATRRSCSRHPRRRPVAAIDEEGSPPGARSGGDPGGRLVCMPDSGRPRSGQAAPACRDVSDGCAPVGIATEMGRRTHDAGHVADPAARGRHPGCPAYARSTRELTVRDVMRPLTLAVHFGGADHLPTGEERRGQAPRPRSSTGGEFAGACPRDHRRADRKGSSSQRQRRSRVRPDRSRPRAGCSSSQCAGRRRAGPQEPEPYRVNPNAALAGVSRKVGSTERDDKTSDARRRHRRHGRRHHDGHGQMIYGWASSTHTAWDAPMGIWAYIGATREDEPTGQRASGGGP